MDAKDILIDELESFDPKYQEHYKTLYAAACAAGEHALGAYWAYMTTPEGGKLAAAMATVHDHQADNEKRRALRESEMKLTVRGRKWLGGN